MISGYGEQTSCGDSNHITQGDQNKTLHFNFDWSPRYYQWYYI